MYSTIVMTHKIKDTLVEHAKDCLPNECCGYITAVDNALKTVYKMTNVDASPVHFSFDPKEQFHVVKESRKNSETPLVVYHSHPESPARLSNEDLRLLTDPNTVYVIVSLDADEPEVKGYYIEDKKIIGVLIEEV
jgi:[CysO sulfur-carrier protein]-S-L-cysteine hydrolase